MLNPISNNEGRLDDTSGRGMGETGDQYNHHWSAPNLYRDYMAASRYKLFEVRIKDLKLVGPSITDDEGC